jgi:hypothetical protein
MKFLSKKNPVAYLAETTQYIDDLQRITLLRDKCQDPEEKASYDNLIDVMQEVLVFMNSISKRDKARL